VETKLAARADEVERREEALAAERATLAESSRLLQEERGQVDADRAALERDQRERGLAAREREAKAAAEAELARRLEEALAAERATLAESSRLLQVERTQVGADRVAGGMIKVRSRQARIKIWLTISGGMPVPVSLTSTIV